MTKKHQYQELISNFNEDINSEFNRLFSDSMILKKINDQN
jgi:hypothetical protein